ncbi:MAG: arginine--tRNA ligase [Ruminococcus sp.]|nr:arginine--tRNA ligase [Ruminococcus sp.]
MKTLTGLLNEKLEAAFEKCGYSKELAIVTVSDRPDLCQFQCNGAFGGAKLYHKAPRMIAEDVAAVLREDEDLAKAEIAGAGFINIDISDKLLLEFIEQVYTDANTGVPQAEKPETIVLDYGGPNVAKPLHIGHLRAAVIGEALKRLVRATGRKAIADVHLGDWGLQMGLVMAELEERHPDWECFGDSFDPENCGEFPLTVDEMNEVYPFASAKSKENEEFKEKAKDLTVKMQNGDPRYEYLGREITKISLPDIKKNYENLNVDFDYWYGESDASKYEAELVETLEKKGLLYESEGAMVVDVAKDDDKITVPPVIIKKSDGSSIYATTDLATIVQREKDFAPQGIWYVVDQRQGLHFTQVFRCAEKAGILGETVPEHLGFGTMNGTDGKPYKTRDGGVMKLELLYKTVYDAAMERVKESKFSAEEDKADVARKIAVATIKFGDLINHRAKDYIFDLDKFMAADGKTGSFLLYTVARINSILKKTDKSGITAASGVFTDSERDLLLKIALSGEAYALAFKDRAPNIVCENAYQLASSFSKFYHDNHILTEEDEQKKNAWLRACVVLRKVLEKHLDILGIESVDLM